MQSYGPLHAKRFDILNDLKQIPIQTGDIIYRQGDARGPLNLPFSKLVAHLTKSKFSHASMIFIRDETVFILEVNDNGVGQYRFIDWIDDCMTEDLVISRLKNVDGKLDQIQEQIDIILAKDPDYDYHFTDPDKFYCTESVNCIAEYVGLPICKPEPLNDIISWWQKPIFWVGNFFFKLLTGKGIPYDISFYYIGNEKRGMMASPNLDIIYKLPKDK